MTDFLSNLVDRALERAPVLERRGRSLFEPTPDRVLPELSWRGGNPEALDEAEASTMPTDDALRSNVPRMDLESVRLGLMTEENEKAAPLDQTEGRASLRKSDKEEKPAESIKSPPPLVRSDIDAESARLSPPQRETSLPKRIVSAPLAAVETIVERGETPKFSRRVSLEPDTIAAHSAPPLEPPASKRVSPVVVGTIVRGVETKAPVLDRKPESQIRNQAQQELKAEPLRPKSRQQSLRAIRASGVQPATVAPTIQVTIGRIEVRATPPAPRARAAQTAKPKLGLDDYLRSRSGESK